MFQSVWHQDRKRQKPFWLSKFKLLSAYDQERLRYMSEASLTLVPQIFWCFDHGKQQPKTSLSEHYHYDWDGHGRAGGGPSSLYGTWNLPNERWPRIKVEQHGSADNVKRSLPMDESPTTSQGVIQTTWRSLSLLVNITLEILGQSAMDQPSSILIGCESEKPSQAHII